jgi:hypothetical protein
VTNFVRRYDGLFISNGPGDPSKCTTLINHLKTAISCPDGINKPIFGEWAARTEILAWSRFFVQEFVWATSFSD